MVASGGLAVLTAVGGTYGVTRVLPDREPARTPASGPPLGNARQPAAQSPPSAGPASRLTRTATAGPEASRTTHPRPERSTTEADRRALKKLIAPGDHAAEHVKDVRADGRYLRVYTDLAEGDANAGTAVELCERALTYLTEEGIEVPVVFVQAEPGENGNPVLANILGPDDTTCRVTHPAPSD